MLRWLFRGFRRRLVRTVLDSVFNRAQSGLAKQGSGQNASTEEHSDNDGQSCCECDGQKDETN